MGDSEIYSAELDQVGDDLYTDEDNILFRFNDTTQTLKEVGEWNPWKKKPEFN